MWTNNTYLPKTQIFFHTYYFHFLAGYFNIFLSELNQQMEIKGLGHMLVFG